MNRLQKYITSGLLVLSGLLVFGGGGVDVFIGSGDIVQITNADETPKTEVANQNNDQQKMLQTFVNFLNIALSFLTIIVSPIIVLASWLMSPDWTSGDLFGIRGVLHDMWIMISNITYFIYAVLLIFIALATIFGSEHYGYKALLPKLAIGMLMVPLTWWFVQFIISLSTIVTAQVIEIPATTAMKYNENNEFWTKPSIPKETTVGTTQGMEMGTGGVLKKCEETGNCISPKDFIQNGGGLYGSLLVYSFGVFQFQDIIKVKNETDVFKAIIQIVHQGLIGAIAFLIFGLLVLALVTILMVRAIKLWVYAIFSPFFTLAFTLGDGWKKFDDKETFNITEFIGLAFAPALIGLTLSFGLVIVSALIHPMSGGVTQTEPKCGEAKNPCEMVMFGNPNNKITSYSSGTTGSGRLITKVTIGGVGWTFEGDVGSGNMANIKGGLNGMAGIIGTIIIDVIALVFIWVAFLAGSKTSKVVAKAMEPFKQMGEKVGDMGASLPKYAPIPFTGGQSVASINRAVEATKTSFDSSKLKKTEEQAKKLVPFAFAGAINKADMNDLMKNTISKINGRTDTAQISKAVTDLAGIMAPSDKKRPDNYPQVQEALKVIHERIGKNDTYTREFIERHYGYTSTSTEGINLLKLAKGEELSQTQMETVYDILKSPKSGTTNITIQNITHTTPRANAVTELSKDNYKGKFTETELRQKLLEKYKDHSDKTNEVNAIISELNRITQYFKQDNS